MNKHILLVMRWLNNKDSVSQEELEKNKDEAYVAARAWAASAAFAAVNNSVSYASYWVDKHFETTDEDKDEYEKELENE